jgi:tetratricopeptide (TPR) repeat protein
VLTFVTFSPVLWNDFILFDDAQTFLTNPYYRGLGWTQLRWMWTTTHLAMYRPLTWITYAIDYHFWGLNPLGYHLTGLLLHATTAAVFCLVARRLLFFADQERKADPLGLCVSAAAAALLFAIHPLRAEPVAWASARADLLSGLLCVLCILAYLEAAAASDRAALSRKWMTASIGLYLLSLLSKPAALGLPIVLVVLDIYPLNRSSRRIWWEKVPFVVCALVAAPLALLAKAEAGAALGRSNLIVAFEGPAFYLWKLLVPSGLSQYERPSSLDLTDWRFLIGCIAVPVITLALIGARRRWPAGLAAWVCYLVLLAPTLGVVRYGPQVAADRYTYLPSLSLAMLGGATIYFFWHAWRNGRLNRSTTSLMSGLTVAALFTLGILSWRQARVWHDTETFMQHVLETNPNSVVAHNNLGTALAQKGQWGEAIVHFRKALEIEPNDAEVNNNWGVILAHGGELDEATHYFRRAVELAPRHAGFHNNLGKVLVNQGKRNEAVEQFLIALRLDPNLTDAQRNLDAARGSNTEPSARRPASQ